MTYKKPSDIRYVDMAIYVDAHIYEDDCDVDTCYQYLYHLFYMIAYKKRFFNKARDYDEFALYGASQLYMRYRNPKQYIEDESKRLPRIKSCLNYIKQTAYPLKINFQKGNFSQEFNDEFLSEDAISNIEKDMIASAVSFSREMLQSETAQYLSTISRTVKRFLQEIPYKSEPLTLHRIYVSCLLTLLDEITLSNKNKHRLEVRGKKKSVSDALIDDIYAEERENPPVLLHLSKSMSNYIDVLVNRIRALISKDLEYLVGKSVPPQDIIKSILASPLADYAESKGDMS